MDAVRIDRLQLDVRAAVAHDRAELLKRRLRDAMTTQLEAALARKVDPRSASEAQVFIDEIRIGCTVQAGWDDAAIAAAVAGRLAAALDEQVPGAIAFRDRSEFVAAALVALADGVAHQRWYFEAFDGLKPLTTSQALRTVLCDPTDDAASALARLTAANRARVLACVDDADLAQVLRVWRSRGQGPAPVEAIWTAAVRDPLSSLRCALAAALGEHSAGEPLGGDSVDACIALAQLAMALAEGSVAWAPRATGATAAELGALLASLDVPTGWIARAGPALLQRLATDLQVAVEQRHARAERPARELQRTAFGGAFVLLVVAYWLGWPARLARHFAENRAHGASRAGASNELLLLICAVALQPKRAGAARSDPALRSALGLAPDKARISPPMLQTALRGLLEDALTDGIAPSRGRTGVARAARRLLTAFGERVPACAGSSAGYLRKNLLSMSAAVAVEPCAAAGTQALVCLGTAPLSVLLQLAGITRATLDLISDDTNRPGCRLRLRCEGPG
jgi:hypothetical protein